MAFLKDDELRYVIVNEANAAYFGRSVGETIGRTDADLMPAEAAARCRLTDVGALESRATVLSHEEVDGRTYETRKFPVVLAGDRVGVGGYVRDITERKLAEAEIHRQAEQLQRTVEGTVLAMSRVVETRDPYTAGHERRVAELAVAIGKEVGMAVEQLDALRLAGTIHDVGKIAVPAEILAKPGSLSEVEFSLIKGHPETGSDILEAIDFGCPVAELVRQHHERLDGSGYPRGLAGEDILPEACVLAVADVVEAMSSHRPYRAALGIEAALAEIREHAGVKYDAAVVAACMRLFEEQGFQFTP
jgi:PAS domain S-box-containing protein